MLRITDHQTGLNTIHLKVSGRLVENWATDFEQTCLRHLQADERLIICIDELTFADRAGVAAVARLKTLGVIFLGGSAFVRQHLGLRSCES